MTSDLKQEYLDAKYAAYDDESDAPYHRKRKHSKPKKSNHKHMYVNTVIVKPNEKDSFVLVGVCKQCGKIGNVQTDKRIERKFPDVAYQWSFMSNYPRGSEDEYEDFKKWCKDNYEVVEVDYDDFWDLKYI